MSFMGKGGTCINYNSDCSGDAYVTGPSGSTVTVHCRDLLEFVAEFVRMERISKLEQDDVATLLGVDKVPTR